MLASDSDLDPRIPYPYLLRLLTDNKADVIDFAELVIIGNKEPEFAEIEANLPQQKQLLDLAGFMLTTTNENKHGVCW